MSESSTAERAFLAREPILVGGVVAIAVALRLPDLFGWWPNPDEGIYYGVATRHGLRGALAEALATSHPPLYFLLLRVVAWFSTDFAALRSVALVSGCAAVYVFILIGREIGGPGSRGRVTGLVAGLLLAVSPRVILLSQVIRPYTFLLLLLSLSLLFLLRYLREPSTRLLLAHAVCSLLATIVHYSAVFPLAVMGIAVLVDGLRRGARRPEWLRLLAVQVPPALLLVGLYFGHLRGIAAGPLGDHALNGWLAPYMIRGPLDVWLGFVAFHSMLAGHAWAAPAALFTIGATVAAMRVRGWDPLAVTAVSGFALAAIAAALHVYPFGPTRHTSWLILFAVPPTAWAVAALITSGRANAIRGTTLAVLGLIAARLLTPVIDPNTRPRETPDRVLREDAVEAMAEALEPHGAPSLVFMTVETYELLTPLYVEERQSAEESSSGRLLHFRWGGRDVIVLLSRDFVSRPEELQEVNHLYTAALAAESEFGIELPGRGEPVLVLNGGWRFQGISSLVQMAGHAESLGTATYVPGLVALELDLDAYREALGLPPE